jgi:hypothetical protein
MVRSAQCMSPSSAERGIQFAPLQQGGDDQHGQRENTDGDVRGQPQPGLPGWRKEVDG